MTETLAYGYSSKSTQRERERERGRERELFNEYQHDRVQMPDGFQKSLYPCALDESSLCIGSVNG